MLQAHTTYVSFMHPGNPQSDLNDLLSSNLSPNSTLDIRIYMEGERERESICGYVNVTFHADDFGKLKVCNILLKHRCMLSSGAHILLTCRSHRGSCLNVHSNIYISDSVCVKVHLCGVSYFGTDHSKILMVSHGEFSSQACIHRAVHESLTCDTWWGRGQWQGLVDQKEEPQSKADQACRKKILSMGFEHKIKNPLLRNAHANLLIQYMYLKLPRYHNTRVYKHLQATGLSCCESGSKDYIYNSICNAFLSGTLCRASFSFLRVKCEFWGNYVTSNIVERISIYYI